MPHEKLHQLGIRLDNHISRFEAHEVEERQMHSKLIEAQQRNTEAIAELTKQLAQQSVDTRDIINLYRDWQGTARIGRGVQNILLWFIKWGGVSAAIAAAIHSYIEYRG